MSAPGRQVGRKGDMGTPIALPRSVSEDEYQVGTGDSQLFTNRVGATAFAPNLAILQNCGVNMVSSKPSALQSISVTSFRSTTHLRLPSCG